MTDGERRQVTVAKHAMFGAVATIAVSLPLSWWVELAVALAVALPVAHMVEGP